MSNKSCPIFIVYTVFENGQDFLNIRLSNIKYFCLVRIRYTTLVNQKFNPIISSSEKWVFVNLFACLIIFSVDNGNQKGKHYLLVPELPV